MARFSLLSGTQLKSSHRRWHTHIHTATEYRHVVHLARSDLSVPPVNTAEARDARGMGLPRFSSKVSGPASTALVAPEQEEVNRYGNMATGLGLVWTAGEPTTLRTNIYEAGLHTSLCTRHGIYCTAPTSRHVQKPHAPPTRHTAADGSSRENPQWWGLSARERP